MLFFCVILVSWQMHRDSFYIICLSLHLLAIHSTIHQFIHLSVSLSVCSPICLPDSLSVSLSTCLSDTLKYDGLLKEVTQMFLGTLVLSLFKLAFPNIYQGHLIRYLTGQIVINVMLRWWLKGPASKCWHRIIVCPSIETLFVTH